MKAWTRSGSHNDFLQCHSHGDHVHVLIRTAVLAADHLGTYLYYLYTAAAVEVHQPGWPWASGKVPVLPIQHKFFVSRVLQINNNTDIA